MSRGRTYALVAIAILAGILASTLPHYLTRTYGPPLERREEVTSEERGVGAVVSGTYRATEIRGVKTFSSYAELLNYVDGVLLLKRTASRVGVPGEAVLPVTLGTADKAARDTRASKTNVQVEGVDELDIAKTDGDIIAVAVGDSIYVVDARSKKVVSSFRANSTITGLFLLEKKIVALSLSTELYSPYSPILRHAQALVQESSTTIWVIDVSNAEKPEVEFKAFVTGSPLTARAIGNYIYVLVTQPIETLEVPALNGKPLPPGSIGLVDEEPDSYTTIAVLDLSDYSYTAYSFLTGPGSWVYMSLSRLYVGSSRYLSTYTAYKLFLDALVRYLPREVADSVGKLLSSGRVGEALEAAYSYLNGVSDSEFDEIVSRVSGELRKVVHEDETEFYVFRVSGLNISYSGSFSVIGAVLDQFSMEEMGDYFVVATTATPSSPRVYAYRATEVPAVRPISIVERRDNETAVTKTYTPAARAVSTRERVLLVIPELVGEPENSVSVISLRNLEDVGSLRGLAKGERIYSARLVRNVLFLVTFRFVDPLFAIDLSNPEEPEVLGYLKIPGFSEYLHPLYEDRLLGIGVEDGNLKLSLFDVSDPAEMVEVSKILIECSWTPALSDHRAIAVDRDFNLVYIPISSFCAYPQIGGVAVVSYGRSSLSFIKLLEVDGAQRALYVDTELYVVSQYRLVVYSLPELEYVTEIYLK